MKYFNNKFLQLQQFHKKNQRAFKLQILKIKMITYFKCLQVINKNLKSPNKVMIFKKNNL